MTPVEATSTSSAVQPIVWATISAVSRASARPPSPVPAFAQPALTTIAARAARGEVLARDEDRGRLGEVRGEDAGRGAGGVRHQEREVQAVGLDARGHGRGPEPEGGGDARAHAAPPYFRRFRACCTRRVTSTAFTSTVTRSRVSARTRSGRPKRRMKPSASLWS